MVRKRVAIVESVEWVARNYEQVVDEDANGRWVFRWEKADSEPPSDLARSYMKFAAKNATQFFSKTVPHFLGEEEEVSEAVVAEERKSIQQLRGVLAKYTSVEAA